MKVPDHEKARHYLSNLNYYRIGAYWLPFESDHGSHQFKKDTNFDDVLNLYVFDRELRLLVMDAIERVEVSLRTQWAYHLAHSYVLDNIHRSTTRIAIKTRAVRR